MPIFAKKDPAEAKKKREAKDREKQRRADRRDQRAANREARRAARTKRHEANTKLREQGKPIHGIGVWRKGGSNDEARKAALQEDLRSTESNIEHYQKRLNEGIGTHSTNEAEYLCAVQRKLEIEAELENLKGKGRR